jgi:hypothetical protein
LPGLYAQKTGHASKHSKLFLLNPHLIKGPYTKTKTGVGIAESGKSAKSGIQRFLMLVLLILSVALIMLISCLVIMDGLPGMGQGV